MNPDSAANLKSHARARVEPRQARLSATSDAEASRKSTKHQPRHRQTSVDEQVAPPSTNNTALKIGIERESGGQTQAVPAGLGEQGESAAAAAIPTDALPPFRGQPDGDASQRPDAHAGGNFAATAADVAARSGDQCELVVEIIDQAGTRLARAQLAAIGQRS